MKRILTHAYWTNMHVTGDLCLLWGALLAFTCIHVLHLTLYVERSFQDTNALVYSLCKPPESAPFGCFPSGKSYCSQPLVQSK